MRSYCTNVPKWCTNEPLLAHRFTRVKLCHKTVFCPLVDRPLVQYKAKFGTSHQPKNGWKLFCAHIFGWKGACVPIGNGVHKCGKKWQINIWQSAVCGHYWKKKWATEIVPKCHTNIARHSFPTCLQLLQSYSKSLWVWSLLNTKSDGLGKHTYLSFGQLADHLIKMLLALWARK